MTTTDVEREWRAATASEEAILRKILLADVSTSALLAQLKDAKVATIDEYGSLTISPINATPDRMLARMVKLPAEAQAPDVDGIDVHFLIFEQGGWLSELQIYKDDGTPIRRAFSPDQLEVLVLR